MDGNKERPTPMLTSAEVAEVLRCSRHKAAALLAAGDLRGRKVGGRWRVPRSEVERYMMAGGLS